MKDVVIFRFETKTKEYVLRVDKYQLDEFYNKEEEFGDASDEALQVICDLIKHVEVLTPDDIWSFGEYTKDDLALIDITKED